MGIGYFIPDLGLVKRITLLFYDQTMPYSVQGITFRKNDSFFITIFVFLGSVTDSRPLANILPNRKITTIFPENDRNDHIEMKSHLILPKIINYIFEGSMQNTLKG